uniref:Uncharacterized protein n=1 Tax=Rhodosorus marinus TaxID=101924 RepID=A0A7S2ZFR8_9RHOD|mmetsp:Transcript_16589/g.68052  ORF Transcript_16589/g.68052 Transcript_16589/m.68052 type:complete len:144 (+) Transcript_16589:426-857(+)
MSRTRKPLEGHLLDCRGGGSIPVDDLHSLFMPNTTIRWHKSNLIVVVTQAHAELRRIRDVSEGRVGVGLVAPTQVACAGRRRQSQPMKNRLDLFAVDPSASSSVQGRHDDEHRQKQRKDAEDGVGGLRVETIKTMMICWLRGR